MRRRRYLALAGATLGTTAGCLSDVVGSAPTTAYEKRDVDQQVVDAAAPTDEDWEASVVDRQPIEVDEPDGLAATVTDAHLVTLEDDGAVVFPTAVHAVVDVESDSRIDFTDLTATFYAEDGSVVDDTDANVVHLQPGETWEVWLRSMHRGDETVTDATLRLNETNLADSPLTLTDTDLLELDVRAGDRGNFEVVGEAKNTGAEPWQTHTANGKLYAANGNVIAAGMGTVPDLPPGEVWSFAFDLHVWNPYWAARADRYGLLLSE